MLKLNLIDLIQCNIIVYYTRQIRDRNHIHMLTFCSIVISAMCNKPYVQHKKFCILKCLIIAEIYSLSMLCHRLMHTYINVRGIHFVIFFNY